MVLFVNFLGQRHWSLVDGKNPWLTVFRIKIRMRLFIRCYLISPGEARTQPARVWSQQHTHEAAAARCLPPSWTSDQRQEIRHRGCEIHTPLLHPDFTMILGCRIPFFRQTSKNRKQKAMRSMVNRRKASGTFFWCWLIPTMGFLTAGNPSEG